MNIHYYFPCQPILYQIILLKTLLICHPLFHKTQWLFIYVFKLYLATCDWVCEWSPNSYNLIWKVLPILMWMVFFSFENSNSTTRTLWLLTAQLNLLRIPSLTLHFTFLHTILCWRVPLILKRMLLIIIFSWTKLGSPLEPHEISYHSFQACFFLVLN